MIYSFITGSNKPVAANTIQKETGKSKQVITEALDILCHTGVIRMSGRNNYEMAGKAFWNWSLENLSFEQKTELTTNSIDVDSVPFFLTTKIYDSYKKEYIELQNKIYFLQQNSKYILEVKTYNERPQQIQTEEFEILSSLVQNDPTVALEFEDIFDAFNISKIDLIMTLPMQGKKPKTKKFTITPLETGTFPLYIYLWRIENIYMITLKFQVKNYA
jgi:hypothetical protein